MKFYNPEFKVGILGGGQLGRMFIQEAVNLNVCIHILDPDAQAPASGIAHNFLQGDITDFDTVFEFGKHMNVVTIEIEHVNTEALTELEKIGVKVFPQPHLIKLIQDKGLQKQFYHENNIPTAPYLLCDNIQALNSVTIPFVQKLRKGGYDGKGVQVIRNTEDLRQAFEAPSVAEALIDFEKEISVIVARNERGEITSFPCVEQEFNPEANLVEFLFAPADILPETEVMAQTIAREIIKKLNLVGILAVEMFVTKDSQVLVNEIAPRPHNSGHQTIEANYTSQFEQHLRAILNLPLGSTDIISPSVMLNLLGSKGHTGLAQYQGLNDILAIEGVYPHLYGKYTTKPFRKMGHVTILAKNLAEAKHKAHEVKQKIAVISEEKNA